MTQRKLVVSTDKRVLKTTDGTKILHVGTQGPAGSNGADGADGANGPNYWAVQDTDDYTATPDSTSRILMSSTAAAVVGYPVRYTYGGTAYYGIITAISANVHIDIAGAPLDTGQDLTALAIGNRCQVAQLDLFISGTYGDGTDTDLLKNDMNAFFKWLGSAAYLVHFKAVHATADGTAQPKINPDVAGALVSTEDTNAGLQLGAAATWVSASAVAINTTNYAIAYNDNITIRCTAAGTDGDASDLTVSLIIVLE